MPKVKKPIELKEVSNSVVKWTRQAGCGAYEFEVYYKIHNRGGWQLAKTVEIEDREKRTYQESLVLFTYGATAQAKIIAIGEGHKNTLESDELWIGKKIKNPDNEREISKCQDKINHHHQMCDHHKKMAERALKENRPRGVREHTEAIEAHLDAAAAWRKKINAIKNEKPKLQQNTDHCNFLTNRATNESNQAMESDLIFPAPPENKWNVEHDEIRTLPARQWANRNRNAPILTVCSVMPEENSFISIPWRKKGTVYELSWKMRGSNGWRPMSELPWEELGHRLSNRELLIRVFPLGKGDEDVIAFDIPEVGKEFKEASLEIQDEIQALKSWIKGSSDRNLKEYLQHILESKQGHDHHEH